MCHGERYVFLFVQNAKGSTKKRRHHIVVCSTKEKSKTSHCCVQHQIHVKATRKLKPYVQCPRMQTSWKPCCPLAREKSRHESSELIEYFVIQTHWTCRLQADKLHRTVNSEKVEYKAIHTYAMSNRYDSFELPTNMDLHREWAQEITLLVCSTKFTLRLPQSRNPIFISTSTHANFVEAVLTTWSAWNGPWNESGDWDIVLVIQTYLTCRLQDG